MDPYSFLRSLDDRPASLNGLNGLNPLSTLSGLNMDLSLPVDVRGKGRIAREEAALQAILVQRITNGNWDSLKPNSGKAISVDDHHICVAYHEDRESGFRVWEWHGHLLIFDDDAGFSPEYTYGNFFQPLEAKKEDCVDDDEEEEEEEDDGDKGKAHKDCNGISHRVGLGGIIEENESLSQINKKKQQGRPILHRIVNKAPSALA